MFLTVMMWFIFRENKKSMMVTDGDWVYPVQSDMIVGVESAINIYEDDADEQVQGGVVNKTALSRVMFDQFYIQKVEDDEDEEETYDWFCFSCRRCNQEYEQEDEQNVFLGDL